MQVEKTKTEKESLEEIKKQNNAWKVYPKAHKTDIQKEKSGFFEAQWKESLIP